MYQLVICQIEYTGLRGWEEKERRKKLSFFKGVILVPSKSLINMSITRAAAYLSYSLERNVKKKKHKTIKFDIYITLKYTQIQHNVY